VKKSLRLAYCNVQADTVVTHERTSALNPHALNGQPDQKECLLPLDDTVEALSRKYIEGHKCEEKAFRADQDVRCMVDHLHYLLQPGESVPLRKAQEDTESDVEVVARLCLCANYTLDNQHCQAFMVRAERGTTSLKLHAKEQCLQCAMRSGVSVCPSHTSIPLQGCYRTRF
jgi:hypothetical protein